MNAEKLTKELINSGLYISGCSSKGIVWDINNNEIQTRTEVKSIIDAHDPTEIISTEITFDLPVVAPDFITQTPKPQKTPKGAFDKMISEARKGSGVKKSYGVMLMNLIEYVDDLEKRVVAMEKK